MSNCCNAITDGEICAVCGAKLDPPEDMTPEEIKELTHIDEKDWVCGWLVCIKGPNKGQGYVIRGGKNFIGSASSMDIQIIGDKKIEKKNHAVIVYDAKTREMLVVPGDSHGMVYLQENLIFQPRPLEPFNIVELGESVFKYAPFCNKEFDWEDIIDDGV